MYARIRVRCANAALGCHRIGGVAAISGCWQVRLRR